MIIIIFISRNIRFNYPVNKFIISKRNKIIFYQLKYCLKSNNSVFKYNNKVSFRSVAPPSSKHGQDPKAKKEMKGGLKYNLEDKSAKRYSGKGFEENNYLKQDNLINNLRFFIKIVVSKCYNSKSENSFA